ncbi:hypothetical protein ABCR94_11840 [Streptomyces sp. 21So2-11]|uniref:hypothetical protein n=1 Tax=Streptomyces sp. 21So2-11 TaxID=3144408 RepID=UPI00321A8AEC
MGVLRTEGDGLIETGTNTDGSTFLEVWTPLPGSDGQDGSWCVGDARSVQSQFVRVGRHIVHVDATGAGAHFVMPGPSEPSGAPGR